MEQIDRMKIVVGVILADNGTSGAKLELMQI